MTLAASAALAGSGAMSNADEAAKPSLPPQYVPSVWAPNSPILSLGKERGLRPAVAGRSPLWLWLCDRAIRRGLEQGQSPEAIRANCAAQADADLKKFSKTENFFWRQDAEGVFIANSKVALEFLPTAQGLHCVSFYDLTSGTDMLSRRSGSATPFQVEFLRKGDGKTDEENYAYINIFFQESDNDAEALSKFVLSDKAAIGEAAAKISANAGTLKLDLHWDKVNVPTLEGDFDIAMTLTLTKADPLVHFRIAKMENRVKNAGIVRVFSPYLPNFGYKGESDTIWAKVDYRGNRILKDETGISGIYPTAYWPIQYASVGFGSMTAYMACHDTESYTKQVNYWPGLLFNFAQFAENTGLIGNKYAQTYDSVIGPIQGNWTNPALKYREWALSHLNILPLEKRKNINKAASEIAVTVRPDYDMKLDAGDRTPEQVAKLSKLDKDQEVEKNIAYLGPEHMGIRWYTWYKEIYDHAVPEFTMHETFPAVLKKENKMGITTYPYVNFQMWSTSLPSYAKAKPEMARQLDGQIYTKSWGGGMGNGFMCPTQPSRRALTVRYAKEIKAAGSHGMYLDCAPYWIMDCYDKSHGHPLGIGGHWWFDAEKSILQETHKAVGTDFSLSMEGFCETYLPEIQQILGRDWMEPEEIPLLPLIYGGYYGHMGGCAMPQDSIVTYRTRMGRTLLWGGSPAVYVQSFYLDNPQMKPFLKECVDTRRSLTQWLSYGRVVPAPAWTTPVPTIAAGRAQFFYGVRDNLVFDSVESTMWRRLDDANNNRMILLVNYDDTEKPVSFKLKDVIPAGKSAKVSAIRGKTVTTLGQKSASGEMKITLPPASTLGLVFTVPATKSANGK